MPARTEFTTGNRLTYKGSYRVRSSSKTSTKCISASFDRIQLSETRISQDCTIELTTTSVVFRDGSQVVMSHPLGSIQCVCIIPQLPSGFGYVNDVEDKALCHLFDFGAAADGTHLAAKWVSAIESRIKIMNSPGRATVSEQPLNRVCETSIDW